MKNYHLKIKEISNPVYPVELIKKQKEDAGISMTNYYMQLDGKPLFVICGEAHFSRMQEHTWEDEILKMKMGGLNVIATYVFWIHHEEIEGEFDWSGNKNLRRFLTLCKKHHMKVILRIGPFDHGECRNGGYPDWIFGRPFDVRSNDPAYLFYAERLWREIGKQAEGLLYEDGGPVMAVQLENEYEHASAPWEVTTENSKEWIPSGNQGEEHMGKLKELAGKCGLKVPFYTATAWGGSCAPWKLLLPLWGGYAFRPWMFYGDLKEHPATAEYLMNDFHNNQSPQYYNFDPEYSKEDLPFACCEMGGGMSVFYQYRFQLPFESVGAMAAVKVAGGCNFLGYYMYHGGTNPAGKRTLYLNESSLPKFSYDYQAAIGEFGQVRESYRLLKLQHLFYQEFAELICGTKTYLPEEALTQAPEEVDTLRYAIRVNEKGEGFLFLNNYQDHVELKDQKDFALNLSLPEREIRVPAKGGISLQAGKYGIFPIALKLEGIFIEYATAQLITRMEYAGERWLFFHKIQGTRCEFSLPETHVEKVINGCQEESCIRLEDMGYGEILCSTPQGKVHICVLDNEDAMHFWKFHYRGRDYVMLTEGCVLAEETKVRLEWSTDRGAAGYKLFPPVETGEKTEKDGIFQTFGGQGRNAVPEFSWEDKSSKRTAGGKLKRPVVGSPLTSSDVVNARAVVRVPSETFSGYKHLILQVKYQGDIGYAFTDGQMFHDNFCNGAPWEIDLKLQEQKIIEKGMYLYISPVKKGARVHSESAMAARFETAEEQTAELEDIRLVGVYDIVISDRWGEGGD